MDLKLSGMLAVYRVTFGCRLTPDLSISPLLAEPGRCGAEKIRGKI
jgi:hypothetical protein